MVDDWYITQGQPKRHNLDLLLVRSRCLCTLLERTGLLLTLLMEDSAEFKVVACCPWMTLLSQLNCVTTKGMILRVGVHCCTVLLRCGLQACVAGVAAKKPVDWDWPPWVFLSKTSFLSRIPRPRHIHHHQSLSSEVASYTQLAWRPSPATVSSAFLPTLRFR